MSKSSRVILIDTGFLVALFLKQDAAHARAYGLREQLKERVWLTTWPVITETCYFLQKHASWKLSAFLGLLENNAISIFDLNRLHVPKIKALLEQYHDFGADMADISLVIAAEELDVSDIVSTDYRDFAIYRWKGKPFRNLMQ
ncbi:MAG: PIN domain-containing protein [Myxococcaceae bacterium]